MWYSGSNTGSFDAGAIGFATSQDGISWTKDSHNPLLLTSDLDRQYIATPYVISDGFRFDMWYTGKNTTNPTTPTTILHATSFGNVEWEKSYTAVLAASSDSTAWDSGGVYSPSVLYDGTTYSLWYTGFSKSQSSPQIGFATSTDGINWTRWALNPIVSPGTGASWDSAGVEQPSVIQVGQSYLMYYDGFSDTAGGRIGIASSPAPIVAPEFPASATSLIIALSVFGVVSIMQLSGRRRRSRLATP
jgi:predicted GH43/DUF377 family glycosyl hydrolase